MPWLWNATACSTKRPGRELADARGDVLGARAELALVGIAGLDDAERQAVRGQERATVRSRSPAGTLARARSTIASRERLGELGRATPVRSARRSRARARPRARPPSPRRRRRRRVLRERHDDDASRSASARELGEDLLRVRTKEAIRGANGHAEARLEALRDLAIDGVERRAPADRLVASPHLGEQLGRRGVTAADVRRETPAARRAPRRVPCAMSRTASPRIAARDRAHDRADVRARSR